jgi:hypothetical protein
MAVSNGNPSFEEHIPSELPVVAMSGDGTTVTFDQENEE